MVTIKDIAKACGISVTQTSRALNNYDDVSKSTKEKVHKVAKELGYVKNITAQRLASKSSNQLAIITQGLEDDDNQVGTSVIFNTIKGINKFALSVHYEPIIYLVESKMDTSFYDFFRQRNIAGAILQGVKYDDENFQQLIKSDFPCVAIDVNIEGKNKGCVVINNCYYSMLAVEKMIEKGRKNIAMISGHKHAMVTIERKIGYQTALEKNGLKFKEELIIDAEFSYDIAYKKTKKLLKDYSEIDGIFCASDTMALGTLKAIQESNKSIPKDISLFGFDGISTSRFTNPPLSTIQQNYIKKGEEAARLLYEILTKKSKERTIVVPCDVILTNSI